MPGWSVAVGTGADGRGAGAPNVVCARSWMGAGSAFAAAAPEKATTADAIMVSDADDRGAPALSHVQSRANQP